ncbi:6-phosphogluconolactonase [Marinobacterium sp. xm-d-579]|nr:6-phosphogluconolactonase [Marinobacterium sp. xm-d-579]
MSNMIQFDTRESLESRLSEEIVALLKAGIEERGRATLVVSGGRTPAALFQSLSVQELDWSKVWITLADERWVPDTHEDSNALSVKTHLLQNRAAAAHFIPHFNDAEYPCSGQTKLEEVLSELPKEFDAVILGMGEDGHTASFFPNAPELTAALNPYGFKACMGVTPPVAPHLRMTLTLQRLLHAKRIFIHLCGDSKLPVLEQAMGEGDTEEMPVRAVLRQSKTPVDIYWAP